MKEYMNFNAPYLNDYASTEKEKVTVFELSILIGVIGFLVAGVVPQNFISAPVVFFIAFLFAFVGLTVDVILQANTTIVETQEDSNRNENKNYINTSELSKKNLINKYIENCNFQYNSLGNLLSKFTEEETNALLNLFLTENINKESSINRNIISQNELRIYTSDNLWIKRTHGLLGSHLDTPIFFYASSQDLALTKAPITYTKIVFPSEISEKELAEQFLNLILIIQRIEEIVENIGDRDQKVTVYKELNKTLGRLHSR